MNPKTCAFTGHRPQNLPFGFNEEDKRCVWLKEILRSKITRLIVEERISHFISGMAIGIDMYAAEIVLSLKKDCPGITLEGVIPCTSQADKWPEQLQKRYADIFSKCDKTTYIQKNYTFNCMYKRNKYMVDQADIILAVWDGSRGGTANTVKYALSQNKPVQIIHPQTLLVENL